MRKIIVISLLIIIIAGIFYNCFAFEIGTKELVNLGTCEIFLKYQGKEKEVPFIVYKKDGKTYPAYCLNPEYYGIGTGGTPEYSVIGDTRLEDENVWRALINGYPYKTLQELGVNSKEEAFTATKFAVYTLMQNRDINDYSPVDTEAGRRTYSAYLKIVENARNSKESLKDNNKISIISETDKWDIDNINSEYVSKTYSISANITNGIYEVSILDNTKDGIIITNLENQEQSKFDLNEKFKILIPRSNLSENNTFKISVVSDLETKPIVYGKTTIPETQNYAISGYMTEECKTLLEETCQKDVTKIKIIKKEYGTENRLQGVVFNLLDSNKNIIKENLSTDVNGEIIIDKILPGKYFIQEVKTLDGYNLYEELIEINLKFNEEVQTIINNTLESITEISKQTDIVDVTSNYTETEYLEDKISTVKNTNEIKKLPVTGY